MRSDKNEGLLKLVGIESDESELVGKVILQAALFGFQNIFTRTAVFALFLEAFSASDLPFLYILTGLSVPILGAGYTRYQNRVGNLRAYSMALIVVLGLLILMLLATHVPVVHRAAFFALPVLYLGVYRFLDLVLAGTKNSVFTLRQTKRLSGLISIGAKLSMLLGGLTIPLLMIFVDVQSLIVISALMIVAARWNQKRILKMATITVELSSDKGSNASTEAPNLAANHHPREVSAYKRYVRSILAIQAGLSAMYFAIDNAFLTEVRDYCPTAEDVGAFLGYTSAGAALLSMIVGSVSGRFLVGRLGTIALIRLTPLLVAGLAIIGIVSVAIVPDSMWVLGILVVMRVGERACTPTVFYPSYDALFQSLPSPQGAKYHGLSLTLSGPLAGAVVGAFLLALGAITDVSTLHLVVVVAVIAVLMIVACQAAIEPYRATLEYALRSQRIERLTLNLGDEGSIRLLESGLESERADEVIYAFELLRENALPRARLLHSKLLSHPSIAVRVHMVEVLEHLNDPDREARLISMLSTEAAPTVKASILHALAEGRSERTHDVLNPFLLGEHPRLLIAAAAAMIKHGSLHSIIHAGIKLEQLQASENPHERAMAAEIIGLVGNSAFYHGLEVLMSDPHLSVQKAAFTAAGQLVSPQLLPGLLEGLSNPAIRATAMDALRNVGKPAFDALWERISDPSQPLHLRRQALSLLAEYPTSDNRARLVDELKTTDLDHLHACLATLVAGGYKALDTHQDMVESLFEAEGGRAIDILTAIKQFSRATMTGGVQLHETLNEEYRHIVERVIFLACFTMPELPFRRICESVYLGQRKEIAFFCELIEERLSTHIASRVVPLIEPLEDSRRIEKLCKLYNREPKDALSQLMEIAKGSFTVQNPWLAVCARRFLDELHQREDSQDETKSADYIHLEYQVRCLQGVDLFSEMPSSVLAHLLKFCQIRELDAADVLAQRGENYQGLYIVESGRLVDSKEKVYPPKSYVGLESLLGGESVEESLSATEPTRILILSQDVFRLVMYDSLPVFSRVLRRLSDSLRNLILARNKPESHLGVSASSTKADHVVQQRLLLKGMTLFASLDTESLDQIVAKSTVRRFTSGDVVLTEGDVTEKIYLIVGGSVLLKAEDRLHARLGEGGVFGKFGWMGYAPAMMTSVQTECETLLLEIDGTAVESLLWSGDSTIWAVLRHMNEQRHIFKERLTDFTWF